MDINFLTHVKKHYFCVVITILARVQKLRAPKPTIQRIYFCTGL